VSREHLLARKNLVTNFAGRVAQVNDVKVVIAGGFSGERLSTCAANEAPVTFNNLFGSQHFRSESNPS
jgi:NADH:ubiquinone oxidoreductase subunit F (NADH-binding)